jgi:hypothetical protein
MAKGWHGDQTPALAHSSKQHYGERGNLTSPPNQQGNLSPRKESQAAGRTDNICGGQVPKTYKLTGRPRNH